MDYLVGKGIISAPDLAASTRDLAMAGAPVMAPAPRISTNQNRQTVIEMPGLAPVSQGADGWGGWIGMMESADKEISSRVVKQDKPGMINIGLNEEMADAIFEEYQRYAVEVKAEAGRVIVQRLKLGDITINLFRDNAEGRKELAGRINKFADEKRMTKEDKLNRVVTFAYLKEGEAQDKSLDDISYTVYLTGKVGKTVTPIGACSMTGLAILNYNDIKDREGADIEEAINLIAKGIASLAGTDNFEEIAKEITKDRKLLSSGLLLVKIRPIDTGEIVQFHKREAEVLRAL